MKRELVQAITSALSDGVPACVIYDALMDMCKSMETRANEELKSCADAYQKAVDDANTKINELGDDAK